MAFLDAVLLRGGSKQCMPKGKHGLFAGPLPTQPLKQVLQNPQQSYNAVLSQ